MSKERVARSAGLPAGRELDALIAEKVMGRHIIHKEIVLKGGIGDCPFYSTNIAAAWLVVEKLSKPFELNRHLNGSYRVVFAGYHYRESESAPHAICLAALRAIGYKI